jgi:hypothetical protein
MSSRSAPPGWMARTHVSLPAIVDINHRQPRMDGPEHGQKDPALGRDRYRPVSGAAPSRGRRPRPRGRRGCGARSSCCPTPARRTTDALPSPPEHHALPAGADGIEWPGPQPAHAQPVRTAPARLGPARDLPQLMACSLPEDVHPAARRQQRERDRGEMPMQAERAGPSVAAGLKAADHSRLFHDPRQNTSIAPWPARWPPARRRAGPCPDCAAWSSSGPGGGSRARARNPLISARASGSDTVCPPSVQANCHQ